MEAKTPTARREAIIIFREQAQKEIEDDKKQRDILNDRIKENEEFLKETQYFEPKEKH